MPRRMNACNATPGSCQCEWEGGPSLAQSLDRKMEQPEVSIEVLRGFCLYHKFRYADEALQHF